MRRIFLLVIGLAIGAIAWAQYTPKPGETVMRMNIQGKGVVDILLYTKQAPKTTSRIIELVQSGFYDRQKFFEVARKPRPYMARFGDPNTKSKPLDDRSIGTGGSGQKIPFEDSGFKHIEGAVGLARQDNDKDSGDSMFYIMLAPAKFLDGAYTVFGQVVSGLDVLQRLDVGDAATSVTIVRG